MKAFEEWWKKQLCSNNSSYETIAKIAWKTALEHAVHKLKTDANGFFELIKELGE